MPVLGLLSYTLEVPSLDVGVRFYEDAGLIATVDSDTAILRCAEQQRPCVILKGGAAHKRLHHVALRASDLEEVSTAVDAAGGRVVAAPEGQNAEGLWVEDPNGLLYHLVEHAADAEPEPVATYEINAPGRIVRNRRAAMKPIGDYPAVRPRKLGHVLTFSPNVMASVRFVVDALGMGLADHAGEFVAFTCARKNSDHHVLAFALSAGVGFHHGSFQVDDPDAVGRAGRALLAKAGRGDWGFGRHTVGSNYFHYIQDPWGSWFEYYADMDYIDDFSLWTTTNYGPEDSMANWGPPLPSDFSRNCEVEGAMA